MQMQSVNCNRCGAPLEVASSANYVTCNHCSTQLKIRRTESTAFTEQLDQLESNQGEMLEKLDRLERQSRLATLERDWDNQVQEFMVTDNNGVKKLPSEGNAVFGMIFVVAFGIFWMTMASRISPPMALFGVLFIAFGIFGCLRVRNKSEELRRARRRYQQQRREIMEKD